MGSENCIWWFENGKRNYILHVHWKWILVSRAHPQRHFWGLAASNCRSFPCCCCFRILCCICVIPKTFLFRWELLEYTHFPKMLSFFFFLFSILQNRILVFRFECSTAKEKRNSRWSSAKSVRWKILSISQGRSLKYLTRTTHETGFVEISLYPPTSSSLAADLVTRRSFQTLQLELTSKRSSWRI